MFKYWWIVLVGAIFALNGCSWEDVTDIRATYPIQGITAYKGQSVSSLFNDNGAPNDVQQLSQNRVLWIYYTNYRPVGGGELISYNQPSPAQQGTTCAVKVILYNDTVEQVMSDCK